MTESVRRDVFAVIICKNMLRQVIFLLAEIAQQNVKGGEKTEGAGNVATDQEAQ